MSASHKVMCDAKHIRPSVRYIAIKNENAIDVCLKSFPNVTELTLDSSVSDPHTLFVTDALRRTICVTHLQKLTFVSHYLNFNELLDVLLYAPNIHTLSVIGFSTNAKEISTLRKSEKFRLISEQNKIKHIIIKDYSLMVIKMLIDLCPRLQHLCFDRQEKCFVEIAHYLLLKNTRKYSDISSLSVCSFLLDSNLIKKVDTVVKSKKHIDDYSLKIFPYEFYMWW